MFAFAAAGRPRTRRERFLIHALSVFEGDNEGAVFEAADLADPEPMSSGAFGDVHAVGDDLVIKFIVYPPEQDEGDRGARVRREFQLGFKAGRHPRGVGPRVFGYLVPASGSVQGAILMERMDGDVGRLLSRRPAEALLAIEEQVPSLIATMVDIGMTCTDLKRSNMLYRDTGVGVRLFFSDFDAEFCRDGSELNVDPALQRIAMATVLSETILRHTPDLIEAPLRTYIFQQMERYARQRPGGIDAWGIARAMRETGEDAGRMLQHYLQTRISPVQLVALKLQDVIRTESPPTVEDSDDEPMAEPAEEPSREPSLFEGVVPESSSDSLQFSMSDD